MKALSPFFFLPCFVSLHRPSRLLLSKLLPSHDKSLAAPRARARCRARTWGPLCLLEKEAKTRESGKKKRRNVDDQTTTTTSDDERRRAFQTLMKATLFCVFRFLLALSFSLLSSFRSSVRFLFFFSKRRTQAAAPFASNAGPQQQRPGLCCRKVAFVFFKGFSRGESASPALLVCNRLRLGRGVPGL